MPRTTRRPAPSRPDVAVAPDELSLIDDVLGEWHATADARTAARLTVVNFARWLTSRGTSVSEATTQDCREWLALRHAEVKPVTVAKNWSELRAFYTTAQDDVADPLEGRRSPMARIRMPRYPKYAATHAATVAEVDTLIGAFDRRSGLGLRNAAMVSVMFRSGLRVSEVAGAQLSDVAEDLSVIHLPMTKNLIPRTPPIHPETLTLARRYLRRRGDRPGPLFVADGPRRRGEAMTVSAVQNVLKRAASRTGVPLTPHCLRRGFAVEWLTNGGDMATLMIIGGWETETMVVRYLGDQRVATARAVYAQVAARQVAARRRLRAVV
jgi:integrase